MMDDDELVAKVINLLQPYMEICRADVPRAGLKADRDGKG